MMMPGIPGMAGNSGNGGATSQPTEPPPHGGVGAGGELGGGFSEEGYRSSGGGGGNRWPRQETLALLKIRSDMDVAFRDSSLKGPLWDEISRKLAELGFHRSAKKCKEKFENVYKYNKRTKEGRTSKSEGKTYRFFDQLQALEGSPNGGHRPPPPPTAVSAPSPISIAMPNNVTINPIPQAVTVPLDVTPFSITGSHHNNVNPISVAAPMPVVNHKISFPFSQPNMSGSTDLTSSSSSSDEEEEPPMTTKKRKRNLKDMLGQMMKEVVEKQEELQMKFLDTIERRERERVAREEAWRVQELAKLNREHELLAQERSMTAAKDAAVIALLQKITEQNPNLIPQMPVIPILQQQQQNAQIPLPPPQQQSSQIAPTPPPQQQSSLIAPPSPQPPPPPPPQQAIQQLPPQHQIQPIPTTVAVQVPISGPTPPPTHVPLLPVHVPPPAPVVKNLENGNGCGGEGGGGRENVLAPSPSRWPKAEINALINLRTTLDMKYQDNGPKGPLWEEISASMMKLGYNRNAKRCKEKWENINKYYKKVKESSKKRPEDSKTCPYFHQLDAIYRQRSSNNPPFTIKPGPQPPIMAQPEQQWPLPSITQQQQQQQHQQQQQRSTTNESTGMEDDYEDDECGEYEIVSNKTSSMADL